MQAELKQLSQSDGLDILEMLREIGPGENGFMNDGSDLTDHEFPDWLRRHANSSRGIGLRPDRVPQTLFWLMVDGHPVGVSKLRRYLIPQLRINGGHIGYCIRPTDRGKGYGNLILKLTLDEAREAHIPRAFITVHEGNEASRRVVLANGGIKANPDDGYPNDGNHRFWVPLTPEDGMRRIHPDDHAEILNLWRRTPGMGISDADSEENIRGFLERNPDLSWCRTLHGCIIGTVLCGHDRRRGYIYHVAVDPEFRGRGIGRQLVETSLQELHAQGIDKCHLFCFADNETGNGFWNANGWSQRRDILIWSKNT